MSDYGSTPPPPPPPPPPSPSYGGGGAQGATPPPNYLVWAILSTVLTCLTLFALPLGIASIIFSTQVNTKWSKGDVAGAEGASRKAKLFAILTAGIGLVLYVINFAYFQANKPA